MSDRRCGGSHSDVGGGSRRGSCSETRVSRRGTRISGRTVLSLSSLEGVGCSHVNFTQRKLMSNLPRAELAAATGNAKDVCTHRGMAGSEVSPSGVATLLTLVLAGPLSYCCYYGSIRLSRRFRKRKTTTEDAPQLRPQSSQEQLAARALEHREQVSTAEYTLGLLGYAIGIGNIWRFPYLVGKYGGGAFIFAYLVCLFLVAMPMYQIEMARRRSPTRAATPTRAPAKPLARHPSRNRWVCGTPTSMLTRAAPHRAGARPPHARLDDQVLRDDPAPLAQHRLRAGAHALLRALVL